MLQLESIQFVVSTWNGPVHEKIQSPKIPSTTENSLCAIDNNESPEDSSIQEGLSSEQDQEVFLQPSQAQLIPNMFMPYTEGPKIDWTVNVVYTIDSQSGV